MNNINLLIANADNRFTANDIKTIRKATTEAEKYISKNFKFDYKVDVIVVPPSYLLNTIPEDNISGRTYRYDLIVIVVDTKTKISGDFFYETLCHELSHSLRWKRAPEHSVTLLDDIIFEGLAIVLEEKAMADEGKNNIQYFLREMQKTDKLTIDKIMSVLKNHLNDEKYDYEKIFINGDSNLPRWAGYRLGYYFVKKYMKNNNIDIIKATLDSYEEIKNSILKKVTNK